MTIVKPQKPTITLEPKDYTFMRLFTQLVEEFNADYGTDFGVWLHTHYQVDSEVERYLSNFYYGIL